MILIKQGVVIAGLQDERILEPAYIADRIWRENRWGDVVITGGIDGNHMQTSKHYFGRALDIRLPSSDIEINKQAQALLASALPTWKVLMEKDHIHCQRP